MRKKIIAGNWKMNLTYAEAMSLSDIVASSADKSSEVKIILAPPFIYLNEIAAKIKHPQQFFVSAQNCSENKNGAYTGEVSAEMLSTIGVEYVIIGHSERRKLFYDTEDIIAMKLNQAIAAGLIPIFCCGESPDDRESKNHFSIVQQQLEKGLFGISLEKINGCIIAYEPVWAIGTGKNASPEQAQEMHSFIRKQIANKYGNEISEMISILYGGSVTPLNAATLFSCKDVDGALIGGASLKSDDFLSIINQMTRP